MKYKDFRTLVIVTTVLPGFSQCAVPLLSLLLILSCQEKSHVVDNRFVYTMPEYDKVQLKSTTDTVSFALNDYTYNDIRSFNMFNQEGIEYISFYDRRSESISIYHFKSRSLVKNLSIKTCLRDHDLYKTSAYVKQFDSIYITNNNTLYLVDSLGKIKKEIDFLIKPFRTKAFFDNPSSPVFIGTRLYARVRPGVDEKSLSDIKKWRVLYEFDLKTNKASLHYNMPELYQTNFYGYKFLDYSYCYSDHGTFVFSFPADTNIYESDLADHHIAYNAKSQFQHEEIKSVSKRSILQNEGSKEYALRDSYGAVYFDPYRKYYLRLAKQKISEKEYKTKIAKRKQSVIILNEYFKIIGETEIQNDFSFNSIMFTSSGDMYARIKANDEYALHFIRLTYEYKTKAIKSVQLGEITQ